MVQLSCQLLIYFSSYKIFFLNNNTGKIHSPLYTAYIYIINNYLHLHLICLCNSIITRDKMFRPIKPHHVILYRLCQIKIVYS